MKNLLSLVVAIWCAFVLSSAFGYEGPVFSATVWRGETAYVTIPDHLLGEMLAEQEKPGFENRIEAVQLKLMGLREIRYTTKPGGAQLALRYDLLRAVSEDELNGIVPERVAYCRVAVDEQAQPGVYTVGPLQLRILDRVLPPPAKWQYHLDLWQHPWAVARFWNRQPFSGEHLEFMADVLKTLAECGQKVLTTTLLELPWNHQCYDAYHSMIGRVKRADGSWHFDYSVFDRYVEFGRQCGIGPDIACYTMCPWGYVVRWQDEQGRTQRATAKPGSPEFDDFWGAFLPDFAAHLRAKGWFEHTYIALDERSPEDVRFIADYIRQKAPGLKLSMAGNRKPSDFAGITIDCYSQILQDVSEEYLAELKTRREQGLKTTFYVCCVPARPNTFMTSEDDEAFWLGAFPALSGFDGFLRWAADSWPRDPYDNAAFGNWAPGDTFLVYPCGEPSARLIALRAGIVAAEKARILNAEGALDAALRELNGRYGFDQALKGRFRHDAFKREFEALVNR